MNEMDLPEKFERLMKKALRPKGNAFSFFAASRLRVKKKRRSRPRNEGSERGFRGRLRVKPSYSLLS